jgi:hypothetical protein
MSVAKPFRAEDWWIGKASLLIGLVYLFSIYFQIPFAHFGLWAMLFTRYHYRLCLVRLFINDYFDQEKDKQANKKNFLLNTSAIQKTAYFSIALLMLFAPWYYLPFNDTSLLSLSYCKLFCISILFCTGNSTKRTWNTWLDYRCPLCP